MHVWGMNRASVYIIFVVECHVVSVLLVRSSPRSGSNKVALDHTTHDMFMLKRQGLVGESMEFSSTTHEP